MQAMMILYKNVIAYTYAVFGLTCVIGISFLYIGINNANTLKC